MSKKKLLPCLLTMVALVISCSTYAQTKAARPYSIIATSRSEASTMATSRQVNVLSKDATTAILNFEKLRENKTEVQIKVQQSKLMNDCSADVNQPANQAVCNGTSTTAVSFTGSGVGTTFNWTNNTPSIGLAASGTGDIPSFTANNAGNTPVVATITVTPTSLSGSDGAVTQTFNYTGAAQTFTVPAGVTLITVDASGAHGFGPANRGMGGRVQAVIPVTPGEVLQINVGGQGTDEFGGFNGGGSPGTNVGYGGGGGASDIRQGGTGLANRIIVAGGGGGAGSNCGDLTAPGGHGGGLIGQSGCVFRCSDCQYTGAGGSQDAGGITGPTGHIFCGSNTNGSLGQGGSNTSGGFGTGGGGGYYGGGSGCYEGAGGGSSFTIPAASSVEHTQGFNSADGAITLTYIADAGCTGPSKSFTITVNPTPVVNLSGEGVYCGGSTVDLNATPGFVQYSWDRWAYGALPQTTPSVSVSKSGNYTVAVTDANNCTGAAVATVEIGDYVFNGAIDGNDLSKPYRLLKPGGALPACNLPLTCPGNSGAAGPFHYDQYNITNTDNSNSVCAVVSLFPKCSSFLNTSVYLGTFDPSNNCLNYLGDSKLSFYGGAWVYDVIIPAGATIVVVVVDNWQSGVFCNDYSLVVDVPRSAPGITVDQGNSVCAGTDITLTASPANTYLWSPGGSTTQSITASPVNNTNYQVLMGYGNNGCTAYASQNITIAPLPCGWSASTNGVNCSGGNSFTYNQPSQVFTGTSTNCYYANSFNSDQLAFAQHDLCGNGSITAEVTSISGTALGWAGVTMRESNDPGSKKAQLMTNLSYFSRREFRTSTGGAAYPQQFPSQNRYWLRITRTGNQFVMYISPNGTTWYPAGAQNITMASCIEVGLVITNYTANSTITATFANVSVTGTVNRPVITNPGYMIDEPFVADFNILPNPSTGSVELDFSAYSNKNVFMEIFSIQGKMLRSAKYDEVNSEEYVDLSDFNSGMYLIRVRSEGIPDITKRLVLNTK